MAETQQAELKCSRHGTPTNLSCARCGRPACGKCLVWTEVGQKCKECVYPRFSRERKPWLMPAAVAAVALVAVGFVVLLTRSGDGGGQQAGAGEDSVRRQAAIGEEATDGEVTFVVESFQCGGKSLEADRFGGLQALGRYCQLRFTATNTGSEPLTYSTFGRLGPVLVDDQRRRYVPDRRATAVVQPEAARDLVEGLAPQQLNPGSEVKRVLVFDIAEGVTPVIAELNAGRGPGVEVRLT